MRSRFEERDPVPLEITEETYRDDLHSSIGPSLAAGMRGETIFSASNYPDFHPDHVSEEQDFYNNGPITEDWLMHDEERDSYILVQGKSYYNKKEFGINQLANEALTLQYRNERIFEDIEGFFLVSARPSGVTEPRTDFGQVEKGIEEEIENGGTVRIVADVHEVFPNCWQKSPYQLLND